MMIRSLLLPRPLLWKAGYRCLSSFQCQPTILDCHIKVHLHSNCFRLKMDHLSVPSIRSLLTGGGNLGLPSATTKSALTIAVEGNIGCGKSTLLEYFSEHQDGLIETICEPIEKWTNIRGHNGLGLLYETPERWSFSFNMYAMLTRVNMHTQDHIKPVKMMERSLHSTRYCFVENSFTNNDLTPCEYSIISQWYDHLVSGGKANVDLIIYLKVDPSVCYERLKKRSRNEEASVPKNLLESLHTFHDDLLIHKKFGVPAPVLVVDANPDIAVLKSIYNHIRLELADMYVNEKSTHMGFHSIGKNGT